MQALISTGKPNVELKKVDVSPLKSGEILVKTKAVALNPTDWKHRDYVSGAGQILGCDFCGTVDKVSDDGSVKHLAVGDRVAGFVHGGRFPDRGSFADYIVTEGTQVWKVPQGTTDEEAAALGGIGPHTAVQALYMRHGLEQPQNPSKDGKPFLVWGGATSVGLYAIQLAKLSGYEVIATCSPKNFDLVKSYGASAVYSYTDEETPSKIAKAYPNLSLALDTVSANGTTNKTSNCFSSKKGRIVKLLPVEKGDNGGYEQIEVESTLVYTVFGKSFSMWGHHPASPEDKKHIEDWLLYVPELIKSGKLKSNPIWSQEGGLQKVNEGLNLLKDGKNSGQKVTYVF